MEECEQCAGLGAVICDPKTETERKTKLKVDQHIFAAASIDDGRIIGPYSLFSGKYHGNLFNSTIMSNNFNRLMRCVRCVAFDYCFSAFVFWKWKTFRMEMQSADGCKRRDVRRGFFIKSLVTQSEAGDDCSFQHFTRTLPLTAFQRNILSAY